MAYEVQYSFNHINQAPYLADGYRIYRQDGELAQYSLIQTLEATGISVNNVPIEVTGADFVENCNVVYNYKVSAFNVRGEIECINPTFSGIDFICPTPSMTPTPSITATPSITPSITITPSVTSSVTPTISFTPSVTNTPKPTETPTPSVTSTPQATQTPTPSVTSTPQATQTPTPSVTSTPQATQTPTPSVTSTPTVTPSQIVDSCVADNGIIDVVDGLFILSNSSYQTPFTIGLGKYTLNNVSAGNPIFLEGNDPAKIEIQGANVVSGPFGNGYIGQFDLYVYSDFGTISYKCANHSYMGGQNNLTFNAECPAGQPIVEATPTPTPSVTATKPATPTPTPSITNTPSVTATKPATPTPTPSITNTPSVTATKPATPTPTPSVTNTPSVTATKPATPTPTPSITQSASVTPSVTTTPSVTATKPATPTPTPSITQSASVTPSVTTTPSVTSTPPVSQTPTPSITQSTSVTPSVTTTPSVTSTPPVSQTPTPSITQSASVTPSATTTPSVTSTPPASQTPTPSITSSISVTPSATTTPSVTSTPPASQTPTPSITSSISVTPSATTTPSVTLTPPPSQTPTPSVTVTPSVSQVQTGPTQFVVEIEKGSDNMFQVVKAAPNTQLRDFTNNQDLSWANAPAGATSFSIVGHEIGGIWTSQNSNDYAAHEDPNILSFPYDSNLDSVSNSIFGGFSAECSTLAQMPAWQQTTSEVVPDVWGAGVDQEFKNPISATNSVIPYYFNSSSSRAYGLFDFGLYQCNDSTCSNGSRAETINNTNNAPIAFWVKIKPDDVFNESTFTCTSNAVLQDIGTIPFTLRVTGQWNF